MQADLCDAKAGRDGGEGRHRCQYWFRIGQMDLDPLHDFGEGEAPLHAFVVSKFAVGDAFIQANSLRPLVFA